MKSTSIRALTYSWVSTADKQNPESQATELRRYCESRNWQIGEEIIDRGFSGGTGPEQRPGLARLMSLARARKIDTIVVVKLDRLFRSLKHLVTILDELQSLGVMFVSVGDQIDLTTASGRLMMQIVGAFSEFERSLISKENRRGAPLCPKQGSAPRTAQDPPRRGHIKPQSQRAKLLRDRTAAWMHAQCNLPNAAGVSKTLTKSDFQLAEKTRHGKGR